jgi:hypothetical protein
MLEELERRNYTQTTTASTSRQSKISPITSSTLPTSSVLSTSVNTEPIYSASGNSPHPRLRNGWPLLRFFFTQTLKKAWSVAETPYPKRTRHLPSILSPEEVAHLIDSARTRFHRIVLMTLYGTGARPPRAASFKRCIGCAPSLPSLSSMRRFGSRRSPGRKAPMPILGLQTRVPPAQNSIGFGGCTAVDLMQLVSTLFPVGLFVFLR